MLGESGFDLAEEITEEHPDTALVLITATDDPELARKAFGLGGHGVHGYLVKPFWPGQLLITAMNALRRRELEVSERSYRLNLEERRQKIIDMAPMPIYVKDGSYRYTFANGQADELAGRSEGQLIGETDEAIMGPEALEQTRADDEQILGDGTTHRAEETLEIGGVERTFQTVKFPLLNEKGQATAVCGISIDVTGQRDAFDVSLSRVRRRSDRLRIAFLIPQSGPAGLWGPSCQTSATLASLLYGVKPRDPVVFAEAALVLAISAVLAALLPARRAASIDPATALRSE